MSSVIQYYQGYCLESTLEPLARYLSENLVIGASYEILSDWKKVPAPPLIPANYKEDPLYNSKCRYKAKKDGTVDQQTIVLYLIGAAGRDQPLRHTIMAFQVYGADHKDGDMLEAKMLSARAGNMVFAQIVNRPYDVIERIHELGNTIKPFGFVNKTELYEFIKKRWYWKAVDLGLHHIDDYYSIIHAKKLPTTNTTFNEWLNRVVKAIVMQAHSDTPIHNIPPQCLMINLKTHYVDMEGNEMEHPDRYFSKVVITGTVNPAFARWVTDIDYYVKERKYDISGFMFDKICEHIKAETHIVDLCSATAHTEFKKEEENYIFTCTVKTRNMTLFNQDWALNRPHDKTRHDYFTPKQIQILMEKYPELKVSETYKDECLNRHKVRDIIRETVESEYVTMNPYCYFTEPEGEPAKYNYTPFPITYREVAQEDGKVVKIYHATMHILYPTFIPYTYNLTYRYITIEIERPDNEDFYGLSDVREEINFFRDMLQYNHQRFILSERGGRYQTFLSRLKKLPFFPNRGRCMAYWRKMLRPIPHDYTTIYCDEKTIQGYVTDYFSIGHARITKPEPRLRNHTFTELRITLIPKKKITDLVQDWDRFMKRNRRTVGSRMREIGLYKMKLDWMKLTAHNVVLDRIELTDTGSLLFVYKRVQ